MAVPRISMKLYPIEIILVSIFRLRTTLEQG